MFAQFLSDGWRIFVDFQWLDLTDLGWGVEKVAWRDNLPASRPCSQYQVTSDRIFIAWQKSSLRHYSVKGEIQQACMHCHYCVYFTVYLLWESPRIADRVSQCSMQYYAILCKTMFNHAILYNTMKYHVLMIDPWSSSRGENYIAINNQHDESYDNCNACFIYYQNFPCIPFYRIVGQWYENTNNNESPGQSSSSLCSAALLSLRLDL